MRPFAPLLLVAGFTLGGADAFAQGYLKPSGNGGSVGNVTQYIGGKEVSTGGGGVISTNGAAAATATESNSGLRLQGASVLSESSAAKTISIPGVARKPIAAVEAPVALRGITPEGETRKAEPEAPPATTAEKQTSEIKVVPPDSRLALAAKPSGRFAPRKPFEQLITQASQKEAIGKIDGAPFEELN